MRRSSNTPVPAGGFSPHRSTVPAGPSAAILPPPPNPRRPMPARTACLRQRAADVVARREPEETLAAQHALPFFMQQRPQTFRMKRPPRAVNESADAELVSFAVMVMMLMVFVQRREPARRARRFAEVEALRVQQFGKRYIAEAADHLHRARIDARENALQTLEVL